MQKVLDLVKKLLSLETSYEEKISILKIEAHQAGLEKPHDKIAHCKSMLKKLKALRRQVENSVFIANDARLIKIIEAIQAAKTQAEQTTLQMKKITLFIEDLREKVGELTAQAEELQSLTTEVKSLLDEIDQ